MIEPRCPHCDTPIDEHEPGRCLDKWIDLVVFGVSVRYERIDVSTLGDAEPDYVDGEEIPPPEYSTDIAVAWEVVETFQDAEIEWEHGGSTLCVLHLAGEGWFSASAPSVPLAICRAAIKAVEG